MSGSPAGAAEPLPGPSWDGYEGHDPRGAQDFQGGLLEEERQASAAHVSSPDHLQNADDISLVHHTQVRPHCQPALKCKVCGL